MRRNSQEELITMKKNIFNACINKQMTCKDGAKTLVMHPKAFSRLKKRYIKYGESILIPNKPGPKPDKPPKNKTPELLEDIVCDLAREKHRYSPVELSDYLFDTYGIKIDQSTVYRILKRKRIRYCF